MEDKQLSLLSLLESRSPIDALLSPDQIFEAVDVSLFARISEDERFDRKSSRIQPAGLAPIISAFSNGPSIGGGVVAIGIDNRTKKFEGCRSLAAERLLNLQAAALTYCPLARVRERKIPFTKEDGTEDFILLLRIQYVPERLVETSSGDAFQRIGDSSVKLNEMVRHQVRIDKGERSFEQEACGSNYPDDFNTGAIRRFCERIREARQSIVEHVDTDILDSLRLGRRLSGRFIPNNACILLFGKDPGRIFPGAYVRFLRYEGIEERSGSEYNVVKDRTVEGTISYVIEEAAKIIDASVREFTEWKQGKFFVVHEYPRDAWYELLVNACVHRSYLIKNVPVFIRMFDDRIVFESPGGFMPGVSPENIFERHHPRNPFVMAILKETGEVRCINEGTKRIRREMADAKLPEPVFFEKKGDNTIFSASLLNNIKNRSNTLDSQAFATLGNALALSLTPDERKIINFVMANERINVSDALRILSTTNWHTAKRVLGGLVSRRILNFHSTKQRDPNAFYDMVLGDSN